MKNKTVAILEARAGEQKADLVRKYGGTPFSAPALAEIPDIDPARIAKSLKDWDWKPPDIFIFQTGSDNCCINGRSFSVQTCSVIGPMCL